MKRSMINKVHLEGRLYQHNLERKVTGPQSKSPGTEYISGSIEIATDSDCLTVIPVYYTYVTAKTSTGKENASYTTLANILDGKIKSVMANGKDSADMLRVDTSIALREWYSENRETKELELVSNKRNEGGFIHTASPETLDANLKMRNYFETDIVITNTYRKPPNEERQIPEKLIVKGAIFNFRNALLPVEFSVTNPEGMDFFEGLGASNREPVFTRVWGTQKSQTVVTTQESAFGEALVRSNTSSRKDFVISGTLPEPYAWGDETTITSQDLSKAMQDREMYLATVKQRQIEYQAQKATEQATTTNINPGTFNF